MRQGASQQAQEGYFNHDTVEFSVYKLSTPVRKTICLSNRTTRPITISTAAGDSTSAKKLSQNVKNEEDVILAAVENFLNDFHMIKIFER